MVPAKRAIAEVKAFALGRDATFERTREKAGEAFQKQFNINAVMANPKLYMKLLFTKVGVGVVKQMMPEAKKIGKEHGERLFDNAKSGA